MVGLVEGSGDDKSQLSFIGIRREVTSGKEEDPLDANFIFFNRGKRKNGRER